MTKRLMGALLCALAIFAVGGVASAQAQGLPYKDAKVLAKRLANKQLKGRHVVSFHLQKATARERDADRLRRTTTGRATTCSARR